MKVQHPEKSRNNKEFRSSDLEVLVVRKGTYESPEEGDKTIPFTILTGHAQGNIMLDGKEEEHAQVHLKTC